MLTTTKLYDIFHIVNGEHSDPHTVLGMHEMEEDGRKAVVVRAFLPNAAGITVIDYANKRKKYPMERLHADGFFEVTIADREEWFRYQLEYTDADGNTWRSYDPYSFSPTLSEFDRHLFGAGTHYEIYEKMGGRLMTHEGARGAAFSVWAPNAKAVSVIGDFNNWDARRSPMRRLGESGIWELFLPAAAEGDKYKFHVTQCDGRVVDKTDPYGVYAEVRPNNASVLYPLKRYKWKDRRWMTARRKYDFRTAPMNIYEVHLGSWKRAEGDRFLTYTELAEQLIPYVKEMGYTHIEMLPVEEHPFDGSWGYQVTGYYAPTSRYGSPDEFKQFVDACHQNGISVILDWVPAHFPRDSYGLSAFDGTCLYEHQDPRQGSHPHWGTLIYNYGRPQVSNYLIANALFWVEKYHADGIRMDAVASMLYLDYGRQDGEWIPNMYGGNENLEAIELIKHLNSILKKRDPGVLSIAEESTAFPLITGSLEEGGLGFDLKWNMGFMNDYLDYIKYDPYFRSHHHGELTFSMIYAYSEKFMLVFSHDEVVHGKGTLLGKMPGDRAQKLANLRLTYGYMMTHPGKKLLFMGQDLAEEKEWNEMRQVEWQLEEQKENAGVQKLVKDLNVLYRENKALYECDDQAKGFQWMNEISANECYVSFVRKGEEAEELLLVVANFSGVPREITTGVPYEGKYKEILNTDAVQYGGTGVVNDRVKRAEDVEWDDKKQSVTVKMAPLSLSILQFIPYTEAELEKVIEKRIRKNTPIRKTAGKTTKRKQEK